MPKMGEGYLPLLYIPNGAGRYIKAPVLTTTQRDALTGVKGMLIFNSTTGQAEDYDGSNWVASGQVIMDTHIADLDAHTRNILETMQTGWYHWPVFGEASNAAITADRLYAIPFNVARDITIDRLAVHVSNADAGNPNVRLGIYNLGANLRPGTLLNDVGTINAGSTGVKAAVISGDQALTKGMYFLAVVCDGTPSFRCCKPALHPLGLPSSNFAETFGVWMSTFSYAALPDPFDETSITVTGLCWVAYRLKSLD